MLLQENISLKAYNTFGIDVKARYFAEFKSVEELSELLVSDSRLTLHDSRLTPHDSRLVLGGGSNILFTKDIDGLVLKNGVKGISKIKEDDEYVYVQAGAGENWHAFVLYCIENGWAGVENLSLIPGNVGASPMQNIGAYGVEIKDVFYELKALNIEEKTNYTFGVKDCDFGYRESVFKKKYRDQFVILNVTCRLRKKPVFNTSYGAIEQELEKMGVKELSIKAVSDAVIHIRSSKLPDPAVTGNAGSFFKNPEIPLNQYEILKSSFPGITGYALENGNVKLAAGWMIEQCGWKGIRRGDAGCHAQQALVLVNYGNAAGNDILALSEDIQRSVQEKFGVKLEREVNII
ncbi:MAG TPA: UDP-N-acetylmuramate dehydrogenase [Chitinophagaceae bacterium]|jgi:UDP-N-acetylmuramate dehydrogenase|nr:UDP-N-acetylmuramate dehydrogenase [Chitinophagaceae bacterium]